MGVCLVDNQSLNIAGECRNDFAQPGGFHLIQLRGSNL